MDQTTRPASISRSRPIAGPGRSISLSVSRRACSGRFLKGDGSNGKGAHDVRAGRGCAVNGKQLQALARRRGCRIVPTRDGHLKFCAPDGRFLGKIKATIPADLGYYRRRLLKRILALPVAARPSAPPTIIPPAVVAVDARHALDVMPSPRPLTWREWMTTEPRRGTRMARRRQWRSEIVHRLPEAS